MIQIIEWSGMALVLATLVLFNRGCLRAGACVQLLSTVPWIIVALRAATEPLWGLFALQIGIAAIAGYGIWKHKK